MLPYKQASVFFSSIPLLEFETWPDGLSFSSKVLDTTALLPETIAYSSAIAPIVYRLNVGGAGQGDGRYFVTAHCQLVQLPDAQPDQGDAVVAIDTGNFATALETVATFPLHGTPALIRYGTAIALQSCGLTFKTRVTGRFVRARLLVNSIGAAPTTFRLGVYLRAL